MEDKFDLVRPENGPLQAILAIAAAYAAVILFTRITGVRSFAKMSAYDFAATIAVGSLIASTALGSTPLWTGLFAIAGIFLSQSLVTLLRASRWLQAGVDNRPILLMDGPEILHANLHRAGMIESDLAGQLRSAGVASTEQVRAVVLETSGDVSVLTGEGGFEALDPLLREGLRR